MILEGTYELAVPEKTVWDFIIDPAKIGKCLPNIKSLEVESEDKSVAVIRVGVGPIRSDFKFRIEIVEKQPTNHVRLMAKGTGYCNTLDMDTTIDLQERPEGCSLAYKSDVKVGGVLAGLGQRLMKDTADKTITAIFECIRNNVS